MGLRLDGRDDGPHTLRVRARDRAGNVSALTTLAFTVDSTPPVVSLGLDTASDTHPTGDGRTTLEQVTLAGRTEPLAIVELVGLGRTTKSDAAGRFSSTAVTLVPGANVIEARTHDRAGNAGSVRTTITRLAPGGDTTPPVILARLARDGGRTASRTTMRSRRARSQVTLPARPPTRRS